MRNSFNLLAGQWLCPEAALFEKASRRIYTGDWKARLRHMKPSSLRPCIHTAHASTSQTRLSGRRPAQVPQLQQAHGVQRGCGRGGAPAQRCAPAPAQQRALQLRVHAHERRRAGLPPRCMPHASPSTNAASQVDS